MALTYCKQKAGIRKIKINSFASAHMKKERSATSKMAEPAISSLNWLVFLFCMAFALIRFLPLWIYELFRYCPEIPDDHQDQSGFLIIGHRGAAAHEIENTIPSLQKALNTHGANALEIDISMTSDGQIVLWHDWDPDDTVALVRQSGLEPHVKYRPSVPQSPEYRKPVHMITLDTLRTHYGYTLKNDHSQWAPAKIPTLEDVMKWCTGENGIKALFLDIKTPFKYIKLIEPMMQRIRLILNAFTPSFPVILLTPDENILSRMKEFLPGHDFALDIEMPSGIVIDPLEYSSVRPAVLFQNSYASVGRPTILQLGPWTTYRRVIAHDTILREEHNQSSPYVPVDKLISWTINRRREMKCLIKMGINGILTDYPERAAKIVSKMHAHQADHIRLKK
ncbi:MAG: glycerophosphodiester phosphodiesterase [Calditrichaceae bacterium]